MRKLLSVTAVAALVVVALVAAGCGESGGAPTTTPATSPTTTPSTTPSGTTVSVFFTRGDVVTQVTRQAANPSAQAALNDLLQGPNEAEKAQGYATAIPSGTKLQSYTVSGSQATVDFSREMLNYGGGSALVQAIISQVDNTILNNDKSVRTVAITVDGQPAEEVLQP
ncbi:MAG: GerMN domain-containing protein [Candidatus Geothermincolia bacterium]